MIGSIKEKNPYFRDVAVDIKVAIMFKQNLH